MTLERHAPWLSGSICCRSQCKVAKTSLARGVYVTSDDVARSRGLNIAQLFVKFEFAFCREIDEMIRENSDNIHKGKLHEVMKSNSSK